eukprot:g34668.t1
MKDTETSALVEEDEHQGVDGGEAGVVRLVQGEDELLKGGHEAVGLGGGNRAENKRNAAPSLAPRLEGKRNRNGVPVTWDGAAIAATNIVSQPRNRERTRPINFRSGAFLVTIPVPYREATASGRFNESRFANIDKHLKLGAIVERHVSEKPPGVLFRQVLQGMEIFSVDEESAFPNVKLRIPVCLSSTGFWSVGCVYASSAFCAHKLDTALPKRSMQEIPAERKWTEQDLLKHPFEIPCECGEQMTLILHKDMYMCIGTDENPCERSKYESVHAADLLQMHFKVQGRLTFCLSEECGCPGDDSRGVSLSFSSFQERKTGNPRVSSHPG